MKKPVDEAEISLLQDIANRLRIDSIKATEASKSGHPTSCASAAEIMSTLFFHTMRYKLSAPRDPSNDRFILSKGHAAPILYAAWAEVGLFPVSDLLNLRKIDSDLEGHPTPRLNFIDVGTGSLGQGLSVACGMAYVGKYYDKASYRVYCLIGDGESAEGSVWEALHFASYYKLDNLVAIFDINRLGQSEPTSLKHDMDTYRKRVDAFGSNAIVVDGHNIEELCKAFDEAANTKNKPTALLCKTLKGKNFPGIQDMNDWHGKPLGVKSQTVIEHLESLIKNKGKIQVHPEKGLVDDAPPVNISNIKLDSPPDYKPEDLVATRFAYGTALAKLAKNNSRVIALDGDTKNSTFSQEIKRVDPSRYIECFIAEQNLVGVAIGATCRDRTVAFASTFAAFFTRAFDQIRMGAISQTNVNFVGSHCGVSIGEDGPSQMALEDLALFRSIPGSTVFYPSDAVSTERAIELAANTKGVCFVRTSRPNTPIIYKLNENFQIGKGKIVRSSDADSVLVIAAGVTLHEALTAHKELMRDNGINIRVMDIFTVKPIDPQQIFEEGRACGSKIITVEDHYPQGGLGEAVFSASIQLGSLYHGTMNIKKLCVTGVPRSGPPQVLLKMFGIDAAAIKRAVIELIKKE
ncbi:transketolase-like [Lycorma delicatula]|uniref:transketolase-like n=1 Tax=Lycorma delicatula TaxID=130591 RepID=UPI003F50EE2C